MDQSFGGFALNKSGENLKGKKFRYSAKVKNTSKLGTTKAQLWVRVDRPDRQVGFFDNMDDAKNYNALSKGKVKFLTKRKVPVKLIATEDIGKGAAVLLVDQDTYSGKTIEAAGAERQAHVRRAPRGWPR